MTVTEVADIERPLLLRICRLSMQKNELVTALQAALAVMEDVRAGRAKYGAHFIIVQARKALAGAKRHSATRSVAHGDERQ